MLSIIIPTLNEEKYLPLLLAAIKRQSFSDYEIVVSDGKSEDSTISIARDAGCRVVEDEGRSPARQRNMGARVAKGDTILFLDADSLLPDNFLPAAYEEFRNKNLSAAGFYLHFNSPKRVYRCIEPAFRVMSYLGQYFYPASVGVGIMAAKNAHDTIKGFDESIYIGEDYDYINRLAGVGRYRMITSTFLFFSVRRLEKEGVLPVLWKWFVGGIYFIIRGPIRHKIVKYEFGKH